MSPMLRRVIDSRVDSCNFLASRNIDAGDGVIYESGGWLRIGDLLEVVPSNGGYVRGSMIE